MTSYYHVRVCQPGFHYWDHYPGALSLSQVSSNLDCFTILLTRHLADVSCVKQTTSNSLEDQALISTDAWFSNALQRLACTWHDTTVVGKILEISWPFLITLNEFSIKIWMSCSCIFLEWKIWSDKFHWSLILRVQLTKVYIGSENAWCQMGDKP